MESSYLYKNTERINVDDESQEQQLIPCLLSWYENLCATGSKRDVALVTSVHSRPPQRGPPCLYGDRDAFHQGNRHCDLDFTRAPTLSPVCGRRLLCLQQARLQKQQPWLINDTKPQP